MKAIAVFGASSSELRPAHYEAAREMGRCIAKAGCGLVFGGGDKGVMGACARGAHEEKGRVTGVIPEALHQPGIAYPLCDELIVTRDLRDRMETMARLSDAFVIMTGGFGTLYELFEGLTLNQLRYLEKPVVVVNTEGYYDALREQFEVMYAEKCAREQCRCLYAFAATPGEAMALMQSWPLEERRKWQGSIPAGEAK